MSTKAVAAIILAAWWAATAVAGELPYVLKDRTPDVVGMEFAVDPDRAYLTARDYGLNPDRGEVFIVLRQNQTYGLHWEVGYTDWSKEDGINTYLIDADSGAVVSVFVTSSPRTKKRTEFAINPAEAQVDSVPPPPPVVSFAGAERGYYPTGPCVIGGEVMNARIGRIEMNVLQLGDDRTATENMGLVLESIGGRSPIPADWKPQAPVYPFIKFHKDSLMLYITWDDGNDEYQEPVQQQLAVYAIDSAGNRSLIPDTLVVELPERLEYDGQRE